MPPLDLLEGFTEVAGRVPAGPLTGVCYDSRKIRPGEIFVALRGQRIDAHDLLPQVIGAGAAAVVVDAVWAASQHELLAVPTYPVADPPEALALLAARWHGHPSRDLTVIGVTGTNGKTTTTHLLEAILQEAGRTTGLIGTLGSRFAGGKVETGHTTPQALELQGIFAQMRTTGADSVVMEVSSHALHQARVGATSFAIGVFTNLTVDHLDYHLTLEAYGDAKAQLFAMLPPEGTAVLNREDPAWERMARGCRATVRTFAVDDPAADLHAADLALHPSGASWTLVTPLGQEPVQMRLTGRFNVSNALAAAGAAMALGIAPGVIARALGRVGGVPGRLERVSAAEAPVTVLVDFAHTPDGLANVLSTARAFTRRQLHVVFGCGGDRDTTKRPEMGRLAAELADAVYLTSDNPRSEDPLAIMAAVAAGMPSGYEAIADRAAAIQRAVARAQAGDVVVIAGKGHETYQIVGDTTLPFDDREVARQALAARGMA